jgi:hypothetical protein
MSELDDPEVLSQPDHVICSASRCRIRPPPFVEKVTGWPQVAIPVEEET